MTLSYVAKVSGEPSNNHLFQGPDVTANLVGYLREPVAASADAEEMFMLADASKVHHRALRFPQWQRVVSQMNLWDIMLSYRFGATPSTFCANFELVWTFQNIRKGYDSNIVESVPHNFYLNDLLVSFPKRCENICGTIETIGG